MSVIIISATTIGRCIIAWPPFSICNKPSFRWYFNVWSRRKHQDCISSSVLLLILWSFHLSCWKWCKPYLLTAMLYHFPLNMAYVMWAYKLKIFRTMHDLLVLFPLRKFAVFESQSLSQYYTHRPKTFLKLQVLQAL